MTALTVAHQLTGFGLYEIHVAGCAHLVSPKLEVLGTHETDGTPAEFAAKYEAGNDGILTKLGPCAEKLAAPKAPHETLTAAEAEAITAVFARMANGDRVRVEDPTTWNYAQGAWSKLDDERRRGRYPHVKHFEVRSMDDPAYADAPVHFLSPVIPGRGTKHDYVAAKVAWKRLHGETVRDRSRVAFGDRLYWSREKAQGVGGWFFYRDGRTAAQGNGGIARLARRMNLIVLGVDGRWYVADPVI